MLRNYNYDFIILFLDNGKDWVRWIPDTSIQSSESTSFFKVLFMQEHIWYHLIFLQGLDNLLRPKVKYRSIYWSLKLLLHFLKGKRSRFYDQISSWIDLLMIAWRAWCSAKSLRMEVNAIHAECFSHFLPQNVFTPYSSCKSKWHWIPLNQLIKKINEFFDTNLIILRCSIS